MMELGGRTSQPSCGSEPASSGLTSWDGFASCEPNASPDLYYSPSPPPASTQDSSSSASPSLPMVRYKVSSPSRTLAVAKNQSVPADLHRLFNAHSDGLKSCTCAARSLESMNTLPVESRGPQRVAGEGLGVSLGATTPSYRHTSAIRRIHSDRTFAGGGKPMPIRKDRLITTCTQPLHTCYVVKEKIGQGTWGSVHVAVERQSNHQRAVKKIPKRFAGELFRFRQEVKLMKSLDHPNIVRLFETFEDYANIYMIMEYCRGGELFDRLSATKYFSEQSAASLIRQMLSAICYCHSRRIAHRDLKPENFLFLSTDLNSPIKLVDFGLGKRFAPNRRMRTKVGTLYYVSPQVLSGSYDEKCDVWSIGVMMYLLLSGSPPFNGLTDAAIINQVSHGEPKFTHPIWSRISPQARELVAKLLSRNAEQRPSAEQALQHEWFKIFAPHSILSINLPRPLSVPGNLSAVGGGVVNSPPSFDDRHVAVRESGSGATGMRLSGTLNSGDLLAAPISPKAPMSHSASMYQIHKAGGRESLSHDAAMRGLLEDEDTRQSLDSVYSHWGNLAARLVPKWKRFAEHNQLKRAALAVIARQMGDSDELAHIRELFVVLDAAGDGTLSGDEFALGLRALDWLSECGRQAVLLRSSHSSPSLADELVESRKLGLLGGTLLHRGPVCGVCGGAIDAFAVGGRQSADREPFTVDSQAAAPGETASPDAVLRRALAEDYIMARDHFAVDSPTESRDSEDVSPVSGVRRRKYENHEVAARERSGSQTGSKWLRSAISVQFFGDGEEKGDRGAADDYSFAFSSSGCGDDDARPASDEFDFAGESRQLFDAVGLEGTGRVHYSEFLAACLDRSHYIRESVCRAAFRVFDRDGDGKISKAELRAALGWDEPTPIVGVAGGGDGETPAGLRILHSEFLAQSQENSERTEIQLNELLALADADCDGVIGFEDFMQLLTKDAASSRYLHPFAVSPETSHVGGSPGMSNSVVEGGHDADWTPPSPQVAPRGAQHVAAMAAAAATSAALTAELQSCFRTLLEKSVELLGQQSDAEAGEDGCRTQTKTVDAATTEGDFVTPTGYGPMRVPAPPPPQNPVDEETWEFFGV